MTLAINLINVPIKLALRALMDIDDSEVKKIPKRDR
jgi:hypothetical protein